MRKTRLLGLAATGVGAAAAALATGVAVERRIVRTRRASGPGADELGALHSSAIRVPVEGGITLHAEVDEVAPYEAESGAGRAGAKQEVTLVFVHGYALNLDCWHFQRAAFRGKRRMVFFDQRSHGRSDRSGREEATIEQLGRDLLTVLDELVPTGPVVLIGHSMGGMSLVTLADQHPELFGERIVGVALISTTAGGLRPHRLLGGLIPDSVGGTLGPRVVAGLALAPELVDSARRRGSNIGFLATGRFAFGEDVPASYVEFVDGMLAGTPFKVLAEFFPHFESLDMFDALRGVREGPHHHHQWHQGPDDLGRTQPQDGQAPEGSSSRRGRGCRAHGHPRAGRESQPSRPGPPRRGRPCGSVARLMNTVALVGPEAADDLVGVIRAGFGAREVLDPPSSAPQETTASVAAALADHGGVLATSELGPVGGLILEPHGHLLGLRRVSVHPDAQGRGVARSLVRLAERVAAERGYAATHVRARAELPRTVRFWQRLGYVEVDRDGPLVTLVKALPVEVEARSGDQARALGRALASVLAAGDLVILSGDLGAGKTTFTQGIGAGLGVRGGVTSPTFVISRVHPALEGGPALVHVDAYRLGGLAELDDLDLDTALDEAVTVVEWGEGLAEGLADTRLDVRITRATGSPPGGGEDGDDPRTLRFVPVGPRWVSADLRGVLTGALA